MYGVSSNFLTAIQQPGRLFKSKVTVKKTGYADLNLTDAQIVSIKLSSASISGEDFEIGTTCAAELDVEIANLDGSLTTAAFQDASITSSIGVLLSDGVTVEYCPLGVFYVDTPSRTDTSIKLVCYDSMIQLETLYQSSLTYPATLLQIAQDIAGKTGLTLATTAFPNASFSVSTAPNLAGVTLRAALSWVAEATATFARINRDGKLELIFYSATSTAITPATYYALTHDDQPRAAITQVTIKQSDSDTGVSSGTAGNTYIITGNPLLANNPSGALTAIFNQLNGFSYMPFQSDWQGNPACMVGDKITVTDRNGNSYSTIMTEYDLVYEGGVKGTAAAKALSATGQNHQTPTAVSSAASTAVQIAQQTSFYVASINNLLAGNITATNIAAGAITADKLKAGTITAASGVIASAAIGTANVQSASITGALIASATITAANIASATITAAQIASAAIGTAQIATGAVTTALIGTGAVNTAQIADGSITDAKIVTLTANKISAGTLDASKITVTNLNCANLTVGSINGTQIASGTISASNIASGTITATQIASSTITSTQLASAVNTSISNAQTAANNAATAAANAQTSANSAATAASAAQTTANAAQTSANGKNTVYRQNTQPSGGTYTAGDIWFDTSNGNRMSVYASGAWTLSQLGYQAVSSIDAGTISAGTLSAARIGASSITGSMIAGATITASNIAAGTITASQIAAGTITASQIASGTITTTQIASGTITAGNIAGSSITADKLMIGTFNNNCANSSFNGGNMGSWSAISVVSDPGINSTTAPTAYVAKKNSRDSYESTFNVTPGDTYYCSIMGIGTSPAYALTIGLWFKDRNGASITWAGAATLPTSATTAWTTVSGVLTVPANAVTATVWVQDATSGTDTGYWYFTNVRVQKQSGATLIQNGAITTNQIAANAVTAACIAANTITASQIAAGTITATQIASGAITGDRLVAGTITASQIASATIIGNNIAANTITGAKIAAGTITASNIAANTITAGQIAAGSITGACIAANTITASQINTTNLTVSTISTAGSALYGVIGSWTDSTYGGLSGFKLCNNSSADVFHIASGAYGDGGSQATLIDVAGCMRIRSNLTGGNGASLMLYDEFDVITANAASTLSLTSTTFCIEFGTHAYWLSKPPTGIIANGYAGTIPTVSYQDGGMEIGTYIDFHLLNSSSDSDARILIDNSHNMNFSANGVYCFNNGSGWMNFCGQSYTNTHFPIASDSIGAMRLAGNNSYVEVDSLSAGAFGVTIWASDMRLKTNILDSDVDGLAEIMKIRHRSFNWIADGKAVGIGYVAQELREVDDSLVFSVPQPEGSIHPEIYQIDIAGLIPLMTKAIQELSAQVDKLKIQINQLKGSQK